MIVNGIVPLILVSICSLLVHKNTINICSFIVCLVTFDFVEFSYYFSVISGRFHGTSYLDNMTSENRNSFISSFLIYMSFLFLVFLYCLGLPVLRLRVVRVDILALILFLGKTCTLPLSMMLAVRFFEDKLYRVEKVSLYS